MSPESYEKELESLNGIYSDTYKEMYGIRPRWMHFNKVEDAEAALEDLYARQDWDAQVDQYEDEFFDIDHTLDTQEQELQPGPYDREHLPKYSGMGRRAEELQENLKLRLRRIIREVTSR